MALLGGLLVLVTWLVLTAFVVSVGLIFVRLHRTWTLHHFVTASWWGLGIVTLLAYMLNFFVPLRSIWVLVALALLLVIAGFFGWRAVGAGGFSPPRITALTAVFAGVLALAWLYWAVAATGPVTHYDAGLYQWAAVLYSGDFAVIPGLANLYGPLGYASAEPVLGALIGVTPWHTEGFRLLNGLFLVLLGLEAISRCVANPRRPGTAVALAGTALVYPPMIWMADFWVTSPTPDLPVLVLGVVAAAYLADLAVGRGDPSGAATIVVMAAVMAALRPTALPLAVALIAAAVFLLAYRRQRRGSVPAAAVITVALAAAVIARDRVLSGWLFYPLSAFPVDVPWRAPNPEELRLATLGFARDPADWQAATDGWAWLGAWLGRFPDQWEPWWLLAALVLAVALLLLSGARGSRWRPLAATIAPFALAAVVWLLISPPAFRFGWGPLLGLTAVLLGWGLWRTSRLTPAIAIVAAGIAVVAVVASFVRLDWSSPREQHSWLGIPLRVVPLQNPDSSEFITDSGIVLRVPVETDQCWTVYPLCTPIPTPSLEFIGEGITSGFVS